MAKKKIYTVATSHLDTVWSWDLEETINQYVYDTLVDNFRLFEKYPDYVFNFEGSYRYELMEEYYPELFNKMKEYIAAGRWNVCGSAYENGDVNVPSPEALFRNILIGNSYFRNKFGKTSYDIFLPDCFGFGWALPSVMKHANLKGFTTQKLSWGSAYGTPFDIGRWRGVDGNEVYAGLKMCSYSRPFKQIREWDLMQEKLKGNEEFDFPWTAVFHGTGDRGGAVKEESCVVLEKEIKENDTSDIEIYAGRADQIYIDMDEKLTPEQREKLPVWSNELVMTEHAVGGYTSRVMSKRWNRKAEEHADMAERGSVMGEYLGTYNYNREGLTRSWKRVLSHHFHDDIPGTSCQRVYKRSWNDLYVSMNQFQTELDGALTSVGRLMKTDACEGTPVMVYNSIETDRKGAVTLCLHNIKTSYVKVFDGENEVKSQTKKLADNKAEITFIADVKSLGTKIYDLRQSDSPCGVAGEIKLNGKVLENQKYVVTLNSNGDIESIVDKTLDNKELLKAPVALGLFKYDGSKDWPAWEMTYKDANTTPDRFPAVVSIEEYENGCARVAFKITQKDDRSTFTNIIALTDGGESVEVYSEIEWQALRTMCKNVFSFTAENEKALFDLGLGAIERGNMTEQLFEVPAQKWADITDKSGEFGVSVISECKYGWDKFDNNTLRLTAIHTPKENYRIDSMQSMMDLGLNRYAFSIFSHKGNVGAATQAQARMFTQPMCAFVCEAHDGVLGTEYSFGSVSTNDVIIRAIKKAEESDEIIVRLGEGTNKAIEGFTLTLGDGIESAKEVFASEEYIADATVTDGKLVASFKPYEVKTFALKLKNSANSGERVAYSTIDLEFNKQLVTKQGEIADFKYTIPYEIVPEKIALGGIEFQINKDEKNAIVCNEQKLSIDANAKKLVLICGSLNGDKNAKFKLGNEVATRLVPDAFQRPARWDMYDFKETAKIKDCRVAYEFTHCHRDYEDVTAKSMYLFSIELDVNGATEITLPKDKDIVIVAAIQATESFSTLATTLCDKVEERKFTFKMTRQEKKQYKVARKKKNLHDKKFYNRKNWGKDY